MSYADDDSQLRKLKVRLPFEFSLAFLLAVGTAIPDAAEKGWGAVDWKTSLLIGLAGSVLALAAELLLKVRELTELEDTFRKELEASGRQTRAQISDQFRALMLAARMQAMPESERRFMENIHSYMTTIRAGGHHFFKRHMSEIQGEFEERLRRLSTGRITIDPYQHTVAISMFRTNSLNQFKEMRMVHIRDLEYWLQSHGRRYLELTAEAATQGVLAVAKRVFILEEADRELAARVLPQHIAAGLDVRVADYSELKQAHPNLLQEYVVATERLHDREEEMVVYPVYTEPRERRAETLDARRYEIEQRKLAFELLWERSQSAKAYLGQG
jgi:hypothetical protein